MDNAANDAQKASSGVLGSIFGSKSTTDEVADSAKGAADSARKAVNDAGAEANKAGTGIINSLFGSSTEDKAAADATSQASRVFGSSQTAAVDGSDAPSSGPSLTERIFGSSTTSHSSRNPADAEREAVQRASDTFGSSQTAGLDSSDIPSGNHFSNRAGTNRSIGDDVSAAASEASHKAHDALDSVKNQFDSVTGSNPSRSAFGYVDADSVPGQTASFTNNAAEAPFSSDHGTARIASTLNVSTLFLSWRGSNSSLITALGYRCACRRHLSESKWIIQMTLVKLQSMYSYLDYFDHMAHAIWNTVAF